MTYSHKGILDNSENEGATGTYINKDGSQKCDID